LKVFIFLLFLPTVALATESEYSQIAFDITELGSLGGIDSSAESITNDGKIVGSSYTLDGEHATLWSNGQIVDLGTFEGKVIKNGRVTEGHSIAKDINLNGQIVGYSTYPHPSNSNAAIWINGKIADIAGKFDFRVANSINVNGQVAGYSASYTNTKSHASTSAMLWSKDTYTNLNPKDALASQANAINDSGKVAGFISYSQFKRHAAVWSNGIPTILNSINNIYSEAFDINNKGNVVGHLSLTDDTTTLYKERAFIWSNGSATELQRLDEWKGCGALSINENNHIVGYAILNAGHTQHAALWIKNKAYDLNNLIDPTLGWELKIAKAINDSGSIVGNGVYKGRLRAFLLTPKNK